MYEEKNMIDISKDVNYVTVVSGKGQFGSDTNFCSCRRSIMLLITLNLDYNIHGSVFSYFNQSDIF